MSRAARIAGAVLLGVTTSAPAAELMYVQAPEFQGERLTTLLWDSAISQRTCADRAMKRLEAGLDEVKRQMRGEPVATDAMQTPLPDACTAGTLGELTHGTRLGDTATVIIIERPAYRARRWR